MYIRTQCALAVGVSGQEHMSDPQISAASYICRHGSSAERRLPKPERGVRFPLPAPFIICPSTQEAEETGPENRQASKGVHRFESCGGRHFFAS